MAGRRPLYVADSGKPPMFRLRVPRDLVAAFGQREIRISLGALPAREIPRRARIGAAFAFGLFDRIRRMPQPTRLEIDRALFELREELLADDIVERYGSRHHRTGNRSADGREAAVTHFAERLASGHFDDAAGFFKRAVETHDWEFGQPTDGCRDPAEIAGVG